MIRIAVDGPGGAGKSTISKIVAKELGIEYIDTGAMYRAIGLKILKENIDGDDDEALASMLSDTVIDFDGGVTYLDGVDVSGEIRSEEVGKAASKYSAKAAVREKLVELQKMMAASKSVIMDGRDIGTNVITDAELKIFLTADENERAKRRYEELISKGKSADFDEVLADIRQRDYNDTHRKLNPLKKADDALELDTTNMTIEEVAEYIIREAAKHGSN